MTEDQECERNRKIDAACDRLRAKCLDASPWFWLAVLAVAIWFAIPPA